MILKDEAHCVANCIHSVASIVDEIIVADTGSTDTSVQTAQAAGASVFYFPWIDDFAAARNATIQKATKDWILVLDADEVIAPSDLAALKALTANRKICTEFLQRHYTNDVRLSDFTPCTKQFPELERAYAGYFESNCVRLFPHHEGLEYRNRIHELVEPSIYEKKIHQIQRTQVRIHHYGHTPEIQALKKKSKLYTPLGEKKTSDQPTDWKAYYELGVEKNVSAKTKEDRLASVAAFKKSLELNETYVPTWTNLGYVLMELGNFQESYSVFQQALLREPNNSDTYCNIGVIGLRTNNLKLAEEASLKAIAINPTYVNALRNLGRVYALQNRFSEAVLVNQRILEMIPNYSVVLADIGALYLHCKQLPAAGEYLKKAEAQPDAENNFELFFSLGQFSRASLDFAEATKYFRKVRSINPEFILPPEVIQLIS